LQNQGAARVFVVTGLSFMWKTGIFIITVDAPSRGKTTFL